MLKVAVGTTNELKLKAVAAAFKRVFKKTKVEIIGADVNSGVPSAPIGDGIVLGAITRAREVMRLCDAKTSFYAVGVESGALEQCDSKYLFETTAVCVIFCSVKNGRRNREFIGFGPAVVVPHDVHKHILRSGTESARSASYESAIKSARENLDKTNKKNSHARDSVSMYLDGQYTRGDVITSATEMALLQSQSTMY